MKLHLPKMLLTAVLVAIVTVPAYAMTGWGPNNYGKPGDFYYIDVTAAQTIDTTERPENSLFSIVADIANLEATASVKAKNGITLTVCQNPWPNDYHVFKDLELTNIEIADNGAIDLVVRDNAPVSINQVSGTLSSVNNAGSLNLGTADTTTTFGGAITNTGTLTINGAISFKVDASSNFETVGGGETTYSYNSEKEEGFKSVAGAQYELIGENSGTISITNDQEGLTITKDETTGNVTSVIFSDDGFTDDTFRINGSDIVEAALIADTASTGVTATTKYELVAGTLTVAGDISTDRLSYSGGTLVLGSNNLTIADGNTQLLLNTTGAGNVTLTANLALAQQQATQATGKLTISNKAQLNLGDSDLNPNYAVPGASISSFTAVELDDGTIYVNNPDGTINNLSVTAKGGTINVYDLGLGNGRKLLLDKTTTLNGHLNLRHSYNTQIAVSKLAGTGNLIVNKGNDTFELAINGKDAGYSGEVQVLGANASGLTLTTAQDLGLNVRVQTTGGEIDLGGISSGNTVILNGAVGGIKNGKVVADVKFVNTSAKAGMEITSAADENSVEYAGKVSGGGNYLIGATKTVTVTNDDQSTSQQTVDVMTNTTFSGDTSGYTGQMRITRGEHNVTFTGSATSMNNSWVVENGATANVSLNHAAAATVSKAMSPAGTLNLTVTNSSDAGTKLAAGAKLNNLTVGNSTKLVLGGVTSAATATLGDGASLHFDGGTLDVAGSLTLNALSIDLSKYSTDQEIHTLVSAGTLSLGTGVNLSSLGGTVGNYTATVEQSGDSITLSFSDIVNPGGEITATVTGIDSFAEGMLTLIIDKSITSADLKANITGFGDGVLDSILSRTATDADGIVGITLIDADELTSDSIVGNGADNLGFYGAYYGEGAGVGYQVAYIPEPASATLGLAALMMLAARRRRKA